LIYAVFELHFVRELMINSWVIGIWLWPGAESNGEVIGKMSQRPLSGGNMSAWQCVFVYSV